MTIIEKLNKVYLEKSYTFCEMNFSLFLNKDYFKIYDIFAYPIPILSLNSDNLIEFLYYKDDKFIIGNSPIYYNINDKCLVCQFYNKCGGFYKTDNIETYCPFNITEESNDFVLYDIALEKYKERMMINE